MWSKQLYLELFLKLRNSIDVGKKYWRRELCWYFPRVSLMNSCQYYNVCHQVHNGAVYLDGQTIAVADIQGQYFMHSLDRKGLWRLTCLKDLRSAAVWKVTVRRAKRTQMGPLSGRPRGVPVEIGERWLQAGFPFTLFSWTVLIIPFAWKDYLLLL